MGTALILARLGCWLGNRTVLFGIVCVIRVRWHSALINVVLDLTTVPEKGVNLQYRKWGWVCGTGGGVGVGLHGWLRTNFIPPPTATLIFIKHRSFASVGSWRTPDRVIVCDQRSQRPPLQYQTQRPGALDSQEHPIPSLIEPFRSFR